MKNVVETFLNIKENQTFISRPILIKQIVLYLYNNI